MQSGENLNFDADFLTTLQTMTDIDESKFKDLTIELTVQPDVEKFWFLSKIIAIAPLQMLLDSSNALIAIFEKFGNSYLGATFAAAHFVNRMNEKNHEICSKIVSCIKIPANPRIASAIINLLAVKGASVDFFENILSFSDLEVQKNVAAAIARTLEDSESFLVSKLADIENETNQNRRRGLIVLCRALMYNEISADLYLPIIKILETKGTTSIELSCLYQAQLLLSDILQYNEIAFHRYDLSKGCIAQFESNNLAPEYLGSLLKAFGCSMANKLAQPVLAAALPDCAKNGRKIVECFIPYVIFLEEKAVDVFFQQLVINCAAYRFDQNLLELTARAFAAVSPLVPSEFGEYMRIVEKSPRAAHFYGILRPLLEPKCPPPAQKLSGITLVLEEDKREVAVEAIPERSDGFGQTETSMQKTTIDVQV